jgi:histone H3/H4
MSAESDSDDVAEVEAAVDDEAELLDDDGADDDSEPFAAAVEVVTEERDDDESLMDDQIDEDDELTVKSNATEEDAASSTGPRKAYKATATTPTTSKRSPRRTSIGGSSAKKGRTPSVAGLTIPFRTVKKAMKLDPDIPIVQNEAAIMTTVAAELFLKRLAKDSFRNAKNRGRNTIRYEDVAEARTKNSALAFLETLLP